VCNYECLGSLSFQNWESSKIYVSFVTWRVFIYAIIRKMCVNTKSVYLRISGIFFLTKFGAIEGLCLVCHVMCTYVCYHIRNVCKYEKCVTTDIWDLFPFKIGDYRGTSLVCQVLCFHNCGLYACTYVYTKYVYIRNIIDTNIWNVFSLIVGGYRKNMLHVGAYGLFEICMYTKYA